jgi:hypothetical protein
MRPTNNRGWGGQNVGGWANSGSRGSGGGFPSNVRVIRRKFGSDYGYGKKKTTTAAASPTKKTEETTATAATELDESTKAYLVSLNETGQEKNLVVNTVDKTGNNGGGGGGKRKEGKGKGRQSRRRRRRRQ